MSFRTLPTIALPLLGLMAAGACSSSTTTAGDASVTPAEGGADVAPSSGEAKQTGRVVAAQSNTPIAKASVSAAGKQAVADAEGKYAIAVPKGKPFTIKFAAEDHYQLIEQEYVLEQDSLDRGDSSVLPKATATLLSALLDGYDKTRGVLAVKVIALPPCADEEGAVVTLEPGAGSLVKYSAGGLPGSGTSARKGETISAIFYNVPPNVPVKVTAKHPSCAQVPFPVDYSGVKYTGNQITEPGESLSFIRVFIGPTSGPADAGTD